MQHNLNSIHGEKIVKFHVFSMV